MKTHASQQILALGRYNFLPVAPMVMILVFLKSQYRELSKNVYFYPILILYNVCAVPWGCSVLWGDIMSTVGDMLSTVGVFSTVGGYHDKCRGIC